MATLQVIKKLQKHQNVTFTKNIKYIVPKNKDGNLKNLKN
jgi:hypothetical protein